MVDSRILDKYSVHFCAEMSNRFDVLIQKLKLAVHMISARSIIILYIYLLDALALDSYAMIETERLESVSKA